MTCSNYGQELKDDSKFCTKCGTSFRTVNLALPIASIILSVIGIIWHSIMEVMIKTSDVEDIYFVFLNISDILIYFSIIITLITLIKQKSLIGFVAGLISCVFLIILQVYYIISF